jgi:hypothetical protein
MIAFEMRLCCSPERIRGCLSGLDAQGQHVALGDAEDC